jgi:hypothetical protein
MHKSVLLISLLLFTIATASAQDPVVRWRQIDGIIQPGSVIGSGTGTVAGGMLPWVTTLGVAKVNLALGEIQFVVRGLVLAAGNPIGTRGDINAVRATLVCDTNGSAGGGPSTIVQGPAVPLSLDGDAHFSGFVELPAVCATEPDIAFLIRIANVNGVAVDGPWIAFGAVRER